MKRLVLILGAALLLVGHPRHAKAQSSSSNWVTCVGTVRYWDRDPNTHRSEVVIEADSPPHTVWTVTLLDYTPPVWPGLHGIFAYESAGEPKGVWKNFLVKERFPDSPTAGVWMEYKR